MRDIQVKKYKIKRLWTLCDQGVFAVPEIQREFVWDYKRASNLLDSVYRQLPIGSLLVWETGPHYRHLLRQAQEILPPRDDANRRTWFLIDGQQRLAVLYRAKEGHTVKNYRGRELDFSKLCFSFDRRYESRFLFVRRPGKGISLPYRAIIVDEAQDMSAEAFRLLRAIVPEGLNDLFIVGDAHQRIYRHRTSLRGCGINIKGRGRKLKINYRTTDEIRRFAVRLLEGREIDDLDGGVDEQKGYVSLTHGSPPLVRAFASFADETAFLKQHIAELQTEGAALESVCLVARTKRLLEGYISQLQAAGFAIYEIRRSAAEQRDKPGLRLATMHRVKGLEFEHVVAVAANKGIIPLEAAVDEAEDAVAMRNAETGERSLLYVALTRARRSATITGYGPISPFLPGT